eukprot:CAMPEP_0119293666 /NCGR_PEP_ID=MMETSP1329-20130426/46493_1 /TAXON_ID=114041 /ORGANISM="Genus nov. species nov., Strain RCC1024" /LENGTH=68 /DNA_ID=CAMNT_0007294539 /DNA_START=92 /DNA_END=295 /DNA_ORIENTATION=+
MADMRGIDALAEDLCRTCALLHSPNAPPGAIVAANQRLVALCEGPRAVAACGRLLEHAAELLAKGAPA